MATIKELEKRIRKLEEEVSGWKKILLTKDTYIIKDPKLVRRIVKQEMMPVFDLLSESFNQITALYRKTSKLRKLSGLPGLPNLPEEKEEKPS